MVFYFLYDPSNSCLLVYLMPEKPNYINPGKRQAELLKGKLAGGYTEDPVGKGNMLNKSLKNIRGSLFK